ncbi:hypothetical protein [Clostridium botulinum]|uniref:hypothetical protein n=1 Tax=Clostridium botulinum TaxID=1491 RepID=UPI00174DF740|nr:hypothetical protein [Clostridium botulinum]MBD5589256.1 hypothetical protein [Clostridium botulinum]
MFQNHLKEMIIINLGFLAKQLKSNYFNKEIKEVKEVAEIDHLITEIKMISNKKELKLKQFNKSSLIYFKSLLLQGEDFNTAVISTSEFQENYIKTLQSLPISQDVFNSCLALTDNNIEDAKNLIMINNLQGGII